MSEVPSMIDTSLFDPWNPKFIDPVQSNRLHADCFIKVAGDNVTSRLDPHLIMVRALTGAQIAEYQCEIELDDRDGRLSIPPVDSPLQVWFGWRGEGSMLAWEGVIHDVESGFGRKQGGRRLWVHGFGGSMTGKAKSPGNDSEGEGAKDGEEGEKIPVSQFLKRVAKEVNQDLEVHKKFDAVEMQRDYWQQAGESYYHLAMRLAEEMGAQFRVKAGNKGQFTVMGENIDGTPTPAIQAVWGKNLIAWRVRPMSTRTQWASFNTHHFDIGQGMWKQVEKAASAKAPFNMASAGFQMSQPAPNAGQAGAANQGQDEGLGFENGPGRIVINGEPDAQGNCYVQIIGARPGVDGIYWCQTAEHIYSRQGYITWLDVNAVQVSAAEYTRYIEGGLKGTEAGPTQPQGLNNTPGAGPVTPAQ